MNMDRRQAFRKTPDTFAFLQLERDDGGSVLDVSEGGLRFETFAPVPERGLVHLWFSLNLRERIEAWAEVVWTNAAKKCGGLRFLRLSEGGRAQIREWMTRQFPQAVPEEVYLRRGMVAEMPARIGASETDAIAEFVSKARLWKKTHSPGAEGAADSSTLFPAPPDVEASGELVPVQRHLSAMRRQLILGLLVGTCISAAGAAAVFKYSHYRHENAGSGKASAELSAQKSLGAALPPIAVNPSSASGTPTPTDVFGSGIQNKKAAKARTPAIPVAENGGHLGTQAWEAGAPSPSARAPLPTSLSANPSRQKTTMTPQQLWASVQAGDTKAAVALAELYIGGEGVPQNCTQARVLLLVASEKRNAGAIKRLQELDKTGCPAN
jgi:PilZ domain